MKAIAHISINLIIVYFFCTLFCSTITNAQISDSTILQMLEHPTIFKMIGDTIDYSGDTIREDIDVFFWERQVQSGLKGIEINKHSGPSIIFNRPIRFAGSYFKGNVSFRNTRFKSSAYFYGAKFDKPVDFTYTKFDSLSEAVFDDAEFISTASFTRTNFGFTASFANSHFNSIADFELVNFARSAALFGVQFHDSANFQFANFDSSVSFSGTTFCSNTNFELVKFGRYAGFRDAQFLAKANFASATLPDRINFGNVFEIAHIIDFTACILRNDSTKCLIALDGADIGKIRFDMRRFSLAMPFDDDRKFSIYEQALKRLKDDGLMDSYQILDIEYRKFKARHDGWLVYYIGNTLQDWWWEYGYSPLRVFLWTFISWTIFSFINFWNYRKLIDNVYLIPFLCRWDRRGAILGKKALSYCLQVTTYTAIVFFGLKMDIDKFQRETVRNHPYLFTYLMTIYVVGLVCLGFIVNIIFTK